MVPLSATDRTNGPVSWVPFASALLTSCRVSEPAST